jgi:hypothetical protein
LPAQINDDFTVRQYFQQANQVMLTRAWRNFSVNHSGTDLCFGLLTGYPCCTSNLHQAWPKFTQNLWYATSDRGLAALVYAPSQVSARVADGQKVSILQDSNYPFEETIRFQLTCERDVEFPLHLRIPTWCERASVTLNEQPLEIKAENRILKIQRRWQNGDVVKLHLPMRAHWTRWHENSVAVERGPLTYALKIDAEWTKVDNSRDPVRFGKSYYEVRPKTSWNYGLLQTPKDELAKLFVVQMSDEVASYPWNEANAPIRITAKARRLPQWQLYNESAGPLPFSVQHGQQANDQIEEITLIPYGCTTLRISEFPVVGQYSVD